MGTLGWLSWRVYHRHGGAFTTGTVTMLPPDAFFYSIVVSGEQVGIATIIVDTLTDGVRVTEGLGFDLPIQQTSSRSQFTSQYTLGSDLQLREFRLTFPGTSAPVVQHGTLEGDSVLVITPGTGEPSRRVRLAASPLLPPIMATVLLAQRQRLRTGERTRVGVFDPATLSRDSVDLTVLDDSMFMIPDSAEYDSAVRGWRPVHSDSVRAWRIGWQDARRNLVLWVDIRGLPVQVNTPSGLGFYRSAFEIVSTNYREQRKRRPPAPPGNIVPRTAVASGVSRGPAIAEMTIQVRTNGIEWSPGPDSLLQPGLSLNYGQVQVNTVLLDTASSEPDSVRGMSRWLGDTPMMTLADPQIQARAASLRQQESRPDRIARRLNEWVAQNIERTGDPVLAPASIVLRRRRADVDGHTVLFVALARAAGIPARPVSGILLIDGRFYFHSWAEIFLNRWIPVDPTWNQFPADAGRLRLLINGYARPLDLLPMAAGLDVHLEPARP